MDTLENKPAASVPEFTAVARAIRFALVCILVAFSLLNIRSALSINKFGTIFRDMLGNKPLPELTTFVVSSPTLFALLSFAVPICAVAMLFSPRFVRSFYVLGVLAVVIIAELLVLYHALMAPMGQIMSGLSGVPQ
jgi:hypothetical protein